MIMIDNDKVVRHDPIPGLIAETEEKNGELHLNIKIRENFYVETKICFGISYDLFEQKIVVNLEMGKNSKAILLSQCLFPYVSGVKHTMDGNFKIGENAQLIYLEEHIHSENIVNIDSKIKIDVEKNGLFKNEFKLIRGRAGKIKIDYLVNLKENAKGIMDLKLMGIKDDFLDTKEKIILNGKNSSGIIRSKVVLKNNAKSKILNITEANAPGKGHVECNEILMDNASAETIPMLISNNSNAILTHEASIGKMDEKKIQTLMTKGLDEEKAIAFIINKMLE